MRIRCIANAYSLLPPSSILYQSDSGSATLSLQIDKEYIVYGIWGRGNEILYSILADEYSRFPEWFPSMLFEVVDGRVPSCWRYTPQPDTDSKLPSFLMVFPEWANDRSFNWNLIEGELGHQELWRHYRIRIDTESTSLS